MQSSKQQAKEKFGAAEQREKLVLLSTRENWCCTAKRKLVLHSKEKFGAAGEKEKFGAAEQREIWCSVHERNLVLHSIWCKREEERVGANQKRQLPVVQS